MNVGYVHVGPVPNGSGVKVAPDRYFEIRVLGFKLY